MARTDRDRITKLVDEPFFDVCSSNLVDLNGVQVAEITSVDDVRLERRVTRRPETWETAVPLAGFSSLQILDDGAYTNAIVAGIMAADRDAIPAPGDDYMRVIECTITFLPAYGGGTAGKVFRRPASIVAGSVTAPST